MGPTYHRQLNVIRVAKGAAKLLHLRGDVKEREADVDVLRHLVLADSVPPLKEILAIGSVSSVVGLKMTQDAAAAVGKRGREATLRVFLMVDDSPILFESNNHFIKFPQRKRWHLCGGLAVGKQKSFTYLQEGNGQDLHTVAALHYHIGRALSTVQQSSQTRLEHRRQSRARGLTQRTQPGDETVVAKGGAQGVIESATGGFTSGPLPSSEGVGGTVVEPRVRGVCSGSTGESGRSSTGVAAALAAVSSFSFFLRATVAAHFFAADASNARRAAALVSAASWTSAWVNSVSSWGGQGSQHGAMDL